MTDRQILTFCLYLAMMALVLQLVTHEVFHSLLVGASFWIMYALGRKDGGNPV